jgi:hypothetical protein
VSVCIHPGGDIFVIHRPTKLIEYNILVGEPEEKRPLGRQWRGWDDIKMDLREIGFAIALMKEAVSASKTSGSVYETTRCSFSQSLFHTRRRENLIS